MTARLRLVTDAEFDAHPDPMSDLRDAYDAVQRLEGNPLLSGGAEMCIDAMLSILGRRLPDPQPRGSA